MNNNWNLVGGVAQWLERRSYKAKVAGSIPATSTIFFLTKPNA